MSEGLKYDSGKLRYDLIPPSATRALAQVLTYGAQKYAPDNWRLVSDAQKRYTAALMRHFEAWRSGEINDPESGMPHLNHVLCNAAFLVELCSQTNTRTIAITTLESESEALSNPQRVLGSRPPSGITFGT